MKNATANNVLIAAGFDPSGGAGIARDLRTMWDANVTATAVITAITAQNKSRFWGWEPVKTDMLNMQLQAALEENPCRWVKIGMVGTIGNLDCLLDTVQQYCNTAFVLLDPVLRASTGPQLTDTDLAPAILDRLDRFSVLTPNIPELERLSLVKINTIKDAISAAGRLIAKGLAAVVVKGGHLPGPPKDMLITGAGIRIFDGTRLLGSIHGSGCAFSSAMVAHLALKGIEPGFSDLAEAVKHAKNYVAGLFRDENR